MNKNVVFRAESSQTQKMEPNLPLKTEKAKPI